MSRSVAGAASRSFIMGSSDWPPARTFTSSPAASAAASRASAPASEPARA